MGVEVLWKEKLRTASFEIAALAADLQDDKIRLLDYFLLISAIELTKT